MKLVNIGTSGHKVYKFIRDNGKLDIQEEEYFPYYYEPIDDISDLDNKLYTSHLGEPIKKIYASSDKNIYEEKSPKALESDIKLDKRFLIDKVDVIEPTQIKWAMLDIEIQTKKNDRMVDPFTTDRPISCITIYNNFSEEYKTYYLPNYESEEEMLKMFTWYLANEHFDMLLGWFMNNFDYPLLMNKIDKFADKISPIGKSRYGGKVEENKLWFPIGTSIIDYMEWDKKYTLNRRASYALDAVLESEFGEGKELNDVDFTVINEEVKRRNINDVKDMVRLENKNNLMSYYDGIRLISYVQWEDLIHNSRMIDTLVLREARKRKVVMPSKPLKIVDDDFRSKVLRKTFQTGHFKNVTSYDVSEAYPSTICDFNLDHKNITNEPTPTTLELAGAHFKQIENEIIPTVTKKLIKLKHSIADDRDSHPLDSIEYKLLNTKYKAVKGVVNSVYGYVAQKRSRLYNRDMARAITRLPKEMLLYCIDKLSQLNINPIYADTDGIIFDTEENIAEMLDSLLKKWAKDTFKDKKITTQLGYEGLWESVIILCRTRYHGYLRHANGEVEEKKVGVEVKRKDSTKFIKKFQMQLFELIHTDTPHEEVCKWITQQKELIRQEPIENISFPCSLSKPIADYDSRSIWVRAYEYAKDKYKYIVDVGQKYYYNFILTDKREEIYEEQMFINGAKFTNSKLKDYWKEAYNEDILVKDMGEEKKSELIIALTKKKIITYETVKAKGKLMNVMAFDLKRKSHMDNEELDWDKIIERNIDAKAKVIFEALNWEYNI